MNLYVINNPPSVRWHIAVIAVLAISTITGLLVLRMFVADAFFFETFILALAFLLAVIVAWDFIMLFPFQHIKTKLNATQTAQWVRFGEICGASPSGAMKALNIYNQALKKDANDNIYAALSNGPPTPPTIKASHTDQVRRNV